MRAPRLAHRNRRWRGSRWIGLEDRAPWGTLLGLVALALLVWDASTLDPYVFPTPIGDRIEPIRVILVMDDSGSTARTDPGDLRYSAVRELLGFLVSEPPPDHTDEFAVVHFAGDAIGVPPVPAGEVLESELRPFGLADGTSILAGVEEAARTAGEPFPGRTVLVVFTDGQVSNGNELRRLGPALADLGFTAHLIGLGRSTAWVDRLRPNPFASVQTLTSFRRGALQESMGRVLVGEMGLDWGNEWVALAESVSRKWARRTDSVTGLFASWRAG